MSKISQFISYMVISSCLLISPNLFAGTMWSPGSSCLPQATSGSDMTNVRIGSRGEFLWHGTYSKNVQCGIPNNRTRSTQTFIVYDNNSGADVTCYMRNILQGSGYIQSGGSIRSAKTSGRGWHFLSVYPDYVTNQTKYYISYCNMPARSGTKGSQIFAISHRY